MFRHCQLTVQDNAKVTGRLRDPDDCQLQRNDTDGDLAKLSIGSQPHNFHLSRVKSGVWVPNGLAVLQQSSNASILYAVCFTLVLLTWIFRLRKFNEFVAFDVIELMWLSQQRSFVMITPRYFTLHASVPGHRVNMCTSWFSFSKWY